MTSFETSNRHAWPMRLWLAAPDWAFRAGGAIFFFGFLWQRSKKYWETPLVEIAPYCIFPNGKRLEMIWVPVLVDLTFVLIALSFCFRMPPRSRATNGWIVSYALFTGFAPLILLWISPVLGWFDQGAQQAFDAFMWRTQYSWQQALLLGTLITLGNMLDLWGYGVLFRSFSIVPEPRALKTTGPYRWVRHPVYLGQFMAQGGVLLIAFQFHFVWISIYAIFVAMQLYRSKLEDRVLAEAFGEPCRQWQQRTFWFV